jgi:hypothetical protein
MKRGTQPKSLQPGRLIWVGPLTVLASIAAVLLVRLTAVALLHPEPTFMPLTMVPAIIDTAVLVTLAVFVYHRVVSGRDLPGMLIGVAGWRFFTLDPIPAYRLLAVRALLVSFVPDITVAFWPRAKWPYAFVLGAMHIAAWAVCVPMLTRLTTKDAKRREIRG